MSPKKITRLAIIVAALSMIGLVSMVMLQPAWGMWRWWPAMGLGLAALLIVFAFLRGAYLSAQKRVDMVDMLNDCYNSNSEQAK